MELDEMVRISEPLLEALPGALCVLDRDGRERFANRACRSMRQRGGGESAKDGAPIRLGDREVGQLVLYHDLSEVNRLRAELERLDQKLRTMQTRYTFQDIVGRDPKLLQAIRLAKGAASTPAAILIRGESGTGKELFAQAIHNYSNRRRERLVTVNCSALSEELLESELFGYVGGAFTGARREGKVGLFQKAHRGTLFLDEIGDISPRVQVRLLRALQEHEITPVGGTEPLPVDVRIISATHRTWRPWWRRGSSERICITDATYSLSGCPPCGSGREIWRPSSAICWYAMGNFITAGRRLWSRRQWLCSSTRVGGAMCGNWKMWLRRCSSASQRSRPC